VLAHIPVRGAMAPLVRAASLHDARYVAWARRALPSEAVEPVARDAPLLAALLARASDGHLLQALLGLHGDAGAARAAGATELDDVALPAASWAAAALRALARSGAEDLVELARCDLALVVPAYASRWASELAPALESWRAPIASALAEASRDVPSLAGARVAIAHPLGRRGRALPDRIVVGAPTAWSGGDAATSAALAVHEHAVEVATTTLEVRGLETPDLEGTTGPRAAARRWASAERAALDAVPRRLRRGAVAEAYRHHVATLDRSGLGLDEARSRSSRGADARAVDALADRLGARPGGAG
jgi:hypothetical protein